MLIVAAWPWPATARQCRRRRMHWVDLYHRIGVDDSMDKGKAAVEARIGKEEEEGEGGGGGPLLGPQQIMT